MHFNGILSMAKTTRKLLTTATMTVRRVGATCRKFDCVCSNDCQDDNTNSNDELAPANTAWTSNLLTSYFASVVVNGRVWLFGFALIASSLHNFQTQSQCSISIIGIRMCHSHFIRFDHGQECHRLHARDTLTSCRFHSWVHPSGRK